jgi:hypothetical protein
MASARTDVAVSESEHDVNVPGTNLARAWHRPGTDLAGARHRVEGAGAAGGPSRHDFVKQILGDASRSDAAADLLS